MGNRFLVLVCLLLGCITVPPEYVSAGSTPWKTQMQADQGCIDLLAIGVDHGEGPIVVDRHGFHRDPHPTILQRRGAGVICTFSWFDARKGLRASDNECHCWNVTDRPGSVIKDIEDIWFNACHELHKSQRSGTAIQTLEAKAR